MAFSKAKYVELPTYVVYIGLLYAFLLTSGLILAWVTIYRHEQSIAELRQMLNTREDKPQFQHTSQAAAVYTSSERDILLEEAEEPKEEEMSESGPRGRRANEKKNSEECKTECRGEKGDKGKKGRPGRPGKAGKHGVQGVPGLPGPPGTPGFPGASGAPGHNGQTGPMGVKGDKGESGDDGNVGNSGEKGDKGDLGSPGIKGSQGEQGETGRTYSESAHIVGTGNIVPSVPAPGDVYRITSWKKQHKSGEIRYDDNGNLIVNTDGVYFVYSQMFYYDPNNSYTGFSVYINNKQVLKALYSIIDETKPYHTQFLGGVFRINRGGRIWIGTRIKRKYFFNESSAYFGAFMLHP